MKSIETTLAELQQYIHKNHYRGWDPYDGLNSKLFRISLFNKWPYARLAWIQLFKRSNINLRRITFVPKGFNPKGLALIITGYCKLYSIYNKQYYYDLIESLSDKLIDLQSTGYSGACWGYNFDWQARGGLYFPSGTPTVVSTCFCASALMAAYEITKNKKFIKSALSSANFIIKDLNRTYKEEGFLFSYSPIFGNNTVYNASLMGSKLLSKCFHYNKKQEYAELAHESVKACINAQNEDGSWLYGELPTQNWIDSFHTGYNLECLWSYGILCKDNQYNKAIEKGFEFYIKNFFKENGIPKYYHNKTYPIDIHSPAQLFVTLSALNCFRSNKEIAEKVMIWTIQNMQDKKGFFYYQKNKNYIIKIPYMRWSQAFMFYGICHYLFETNKLDTNI